MERTGDGRAVFHCGAVSEDWTEPMIGLNGPRRKKQPLHVIAMALALILAAFAGAAIGLIWQSDDDDQEPDAKSGQAEESAADSN